jgi:phosphoribosylanthranilate isomerase
MRTWTKICGVTRVEDALAAIAAGADAIGVNFYTESRRACALSTAREIVDAVDDRAVVYGVCVDLSRAAIERIIGEAGITGIQLHGSETQELSSGWSLPVIRAVAVHDHGQVASAINRTEASRDGSMIRVLLDSPRGGGSGYRFDEAAVAGMDLGETIVAGGLDPTNVRDVVVRLRPWGVDTASGVESRPGIKDANLIKEFIDHARSA